MRCRTTPGSSSPAASVRAAARATSSRVNQPASAISTGVDVHRRIAVEPSDEADHQRRRERPGLAGDVAHVGHPDADLLAHLAGHRPLERLARLDEAGQRGEPPLAPGLAAAEQAPVTAVVDEHDHGRVGAGKVLAAVVGADPRPAGLGLDGRSRRTSGSACAGWCHCSSATAEVSRAGIQVVGG